MEKFAAMLFHLAFLFLLFLLRDGMAQNPNKVTGPSCFSCASSALKSQWQVTGFPHMPNITAVGEKAFLFQDANCHAPEYKAETFVTPVSSCPGGICIEMLLVADGIYSVLRGCLSDFFYVPPSSGEEGCTWGLSSDNALIATSEKGELVQNVRVGVNLCLAKDGSQCNSLLRPLVEFAQGKQQTDSTAASTGNAWPYSCRKSTSMVECLKCSRYDWDGDCHWNFREYCTGPWCTKNIGYVNGRWLEQRGCAPFNPLNSQGCNAVQTEVALSGLSGQSVNIHVSTEQCFCNSNRCNGTFSPKALTILSLLVPLILALFLVMI